MTPSPASHAPTEASSVESYYCGCCLNGRTYRRSTRFPTCPDCEETLFCVSARMEALDLWDTGGSEEDARAIFPAFIAPSRPRFIGGAL